MGDDKQIRQAISNLIKNSYENISMNKIKDGKVSIFYKVNKDSVSISINDNGTGINSSDVSKIIDPYFTTKKNNSGLGLSITKKIIDDHNGSILIKNLKSDDGIDILLKFPLTKDKYKNMSFVDDKK